MSQQPLNADLSNQRIVLTGAAGLLGSEYANTLASCGAALELIDIDEKKLLALSDNIQSNHAIQCHAHSLDITNEEHIQQACAQIAQSLKSEEQLVLINNAAIDAKVGASQGENLSRLEHFSLQQWQTEIDVGLTGALLCAKYFGAVMAQRGKGNIINVASDLGVIAPNQNLYKQQGVPAQQQNVKPVTYAVIKHGLIGLTKYLATYWPDQGVRCNAIAPGGVYNQQPDAFVEQVSALIPMGRMAKVDEYNGAMQFLVSDASAYMNGHTLVMDGGRSIW